MLKRTIQDYKVLLRSIPSGTVALFVVSVIVMNLLANKELVSSPWLALDCGVSVSWVSFLCMD
ncbi:MAG: VUT family protein, partial [Coriobacteriaceae bacterium]|nr:VUT family protein [Coriobacteriaceae bacterium]